MVLEEGVPTATGPAFRVIFRLLARALVQAGGAPSASCPSSSSLCCRRREGRLAGALPACLVLPCGSLYLPVTWALSILHRAVGIVQVLGPVVGLKKAFSLLSLPLHILSNIMEPCLRVWDLGPQQH